MKLLIATPSYGGMLTTRYFEAFFETMGAVQAAGHEINTLMYERDALVSRARNACAMIALKSGADKVLFIDSDVVWLPEHVLRLLRSDKQIIGGTYPYKKFPIKLVYNALGPVDPFEAGAHDEVEVQHLPAGFLLIDMAVFKSLVKTQPLYRCWDEQTKSYRADCDFFPIRIVKGAGAVGTYETEDWGFCSVAREAGFKVYLNTKCVVGHVGSHQFEMTPMKT